MTIRKSNKTSARDLLDLTGMAGTRSLAIIGLSKNAGKTTTLNHLLRALALELPERRLALTSVGVDGEDEDVVTGGVKPRIYVREGTLIATAVESLRRSDAVLDIRTLSGIASPFGEIAIARSMTAGYVELAGPSPAQELKRVEELLREEEKDCLYIVDGALSRRSPAGGGITEAAILAVSPFHERDPGKLLRLCTHQVRLLSLPCPEEARRKRFLAYAGAHPGFRAVAEGRNGELRGFAAQTLLGEDEGLSAFLREDDRLLFLRGAITDSVFRPLLKSVGTGSLRLLAEDGTRLFISPAAWDEAERKNMRLEVLHPLSLRLISVNPTRDDGTEADADELLALIRSAVPIPAVNLGPALL